MDEKLTEKDNMREYAVRIEADGDVGTGFLYAPKNGNEVYVFTVYHVIRNISQKDLKIQYQGKEIAGMEKVEYCIMDDTLELESQGMFEDDQYEGRKEDVAVLRIPKSCFNEGMTFPEESLWVEESTIERDCVLLGYGYPDKKEIALELSGKFIEWNNEKKILYCQAEKMPYTPFEEAMRGFSGTGLSIKKQRQLVLIGLVASCQYDEKHQVFVAVGLSEIIETMGKKGWKKPEKFMRKIPDKFSDAPLQRLYVQYMKNVALDVERDFFDKIYQISQQMNPKQMISDESFFDIPNCENGTREICSYYWAGRVIVLLICDYAKYDVQTNEIILGSGEKVHIAYICSEGDGKSDLASVVASAINGKVLGEQIKGNSILIWQSSGNPVKRYFGRKKFKNIVSDITYGRIIGEQQEGMNQEGYHLLNGEMCSKDYGILHIYELIEKLSDCVTVNEIEEKVREIFNGIWK